MLKTNLSIFFYCYQVFYFGAVPELIFSYEVYYKEVVYREEFLNAQHLRDMIQDVTLPIKTNPRALQNLKKFIRRFRTVY